MRRYLLFVATAFLLFTSFSAFAQRDRRVYFQNDSLQQIVKDIQNDRYGKLSGLLIYVDDRLVHETYFGFTQRITLNPITSVTKSITSIAVGICCDKGYIGSIDEPIYPFFPEFSHIFEADELKKKITLRDLLAQTSGFKWDEWEIPYSYAGNPLADLRDVPQNWIPIILGLPMDSAPRVKFNYNSLGSDLIKEIICRSANMEFSDFVDQFMFQPMGISHYRWDAYVENGHPAWGGLSLTTRDMAKVGLLMLNRGKWNDKTIVSKEWVNLSTSKIVSINGIGYGLHWWVSGEGSPYSMFYAAGYGDQYVYVIPELNMVVALNGKNFTSHRWDADSSTLIKKILNAYVREN